MNEKYKESSKLAMRKKYFENPELHKIKNKAWKLKRQDKGLCSNCKETSLTDSLLCEKHYLEQKSVQQLGTTKYWKELKKKLVDQNYLCPYSGDVLILGLNTSIDHLFPKKRFPELAKDLSNIQWVSKRLNLIKNDLTHDELIELAVKIYNKHIL